MRKQKLFCLLLLLSVLQNSVAQEKIIKRVALVVGVQSYTSVPRLQHALNDARDMARVLRMKNFQVIELYDPKTKKDIQNAVRKYFDALEAAGNAAGVFYYSGHGMQVKGSNYLIPVTADPKIEADLDDQCVKMDYILTALEQADASLNILILDACRNNPFRGFSRSAEKGLNMVDAPKGSYIVYATKPGAVASDGTGRNGLFTSKLLKYINTPNLNIEQVFKKVAFDVSAESGEQQRPWIASDYTGDFYFSTDANFSSAIPVPEPELVDSAAEEATIRAIEHEEEGKFYLQKAENELAKGSYGSCLDYLAQAENILGPHISKITYLKVQAYDKIQSQSRDNYLNLKKYVDEFMKLAPHDEIRMEKSFEVLEIKNAISRFEASDAKAFESFKNATTSSEIQNYLTHNKHSAYYLELSALFEQLRKKELETAKLQVSAKRREIEIKISEIDARIARLEKKKTTGTVMKIFGVALVAGGIAVSGNNEYDSERILRDYASPAAIAGGVILYAAAPRRNKMNKQIDALREEKQNLNIELDTLIAVKM